MMGSVIARDMSESPAVDSVVLADVDEERLAKAKRGAGKKLSTERLDVTDEKAAMKFLSGFDVVCSALPHGAVHPANLAAVKSGSKMVDIAFEDEQMGLDEVARGSGALLIPGCGLAPGLGGILLAHAARRLGDAKEGHIYVGGIPQKPQPPFGYRLVFSIVGLLREYMEEARVVRGGKVVRARPFDEVFPVDFPEPVGRLEGFYTDGLATLLYSMKGFDVLDEVTLRWPGHAEKMRFLIEAGFLSKEKVRLRDKEVTPFELSAALLEKRLRQGPPEDMTVMRVEAANRGRHITYELIDMYDENKGVTSMGKTTGYTCSIVAQMVGEGKIKGMGVVPPERALGDREVETLLSEHARRGVSVKEISHKSTSQ